MTKCLLVYDIRHVLGPGALFYSELCVIQGSHREHIDNGTL